MQKEDRRISVREMVESVLLGGDIVRAGAAERMLEGLRGHRQLQEEYGARAVSERALQAVAEGEFTRLTVHGRADVVWMAEGTPTLVEEIKTTRRDPTSIGEDDYPTHWAQAECYAHMLCELHGLEAMRVRLTYLRVGGGDSARVTRSFGAAELKARFLRLCEKCIEHIDAQRSWALTRDRSIRELPFPYEGYRPGQRTMARAAYRAFRDGGRLLCEAPTGIGKTAAMLFSALKAMGQGNAERIFYLTARGTARAAALDGLRLLRGRGLRARGIVLNARDSICAYPGAACMPESCPRAKGHYDRYEEGLAQALAEREDYDADYLREVCERHELCPFEFGLDLSLLCDVIVGDYNYVFDPFVYLRRYFDRKSGAVLLIDEAHNLPDRARSMYSAALDLRAFERLRRDVGKVSRRGALYRALTGVIKAMRELFAEGPRVEGYPEELVKTADEFANAAREQLQEDAPYAAQLLEVFFEAFGFCHIAGIMREREELFITMIEPPEATLHCVRPAPLLGESLDKTRSAVFFSATMTPAGYFRDILGAGGDADTVRLPSPFPRENLLVMCCPVRTTYRAREGSAAAVAGAIAAMCLAKEHGNYLIFFPSYAYLRAVLPLVAGAMPEARLIVQRSGMSERERADFLAEFTEEPRGVLAAFAVMGGLFGEGVDLPGARLSGCAVVGVGLPQVGPEREALRAHYDEAGEEGFNYAYVYPGLCRVVQAAGRVIRTDTDRGVVLLIDERFLREDYGELLPPHWDVRVTASARAVRRAAEEFWEA